MISHKRKNTQRWGRRERSPWKRWKLEAGLMPTAKKLPGALQATGSRKGHSRALEGWAACDWAFTVSRMKITAFHHFSFVIFHYKHGGTWKLHFYFLNLLNFLYYVFYVWTLIKPSCSFIFSNLVSDFRNIHDW